MAVHDGHRDRMRKKIEQFGIESLHDHEVLEYLLYAVVPRKDTNELAHHILDEFGSLANVFDQSIERLQKMEGVTYNMAVFLSSLSDVSRRYYSKRIENVQMTNLSQCLEIMRPLIASLPKEEIHILLGNNAGKLIKRVLLSKGVVNESVCSPRQVVDIVLKNEATRVVLVHNHPSNNPTPSKADQYMTERIYYALATIGVRLEDHIIITKDSYFSYRNSGVIDNLAFGAIQFKNGDVTKVVPQAEDVSQYNIDDFSTKSIKSNKKNNFNIDF